ncbi:hypothetical protein KFE25_006747 [Diacronema lutheri]|uniref:Uncharacterized protein n=1 Tax=Diacronema lutheri TaxID=2081491 RepID=A0A8J5XYA7_DIALT|nr:hypothetical protein KFE25_006747 [Diacronema lutheri]
MTASLLSADPDEADVRMLDDINLPWRHFLRGFMVGCGVVSVPMVALIWIVVSNGVLYRLYPLPVSE